MDYRFALREPRNDQKRKQSIYRSVGYGLFRFARNDEMHCSPRQINPSGKSIKNVSIPSRKNIPLCLSGKSSL